MNRDWMRERLEFYLELCEAYEKESDRTTDYSAAMRAINDRMTFQMPTVREILKRLDPALAQEVKQPQYIGGVSDSLRAVQEGLGILRDQHEWAANLAPDAPSLVPTSFTHMCGQRRRPCGTQPNIEWLWGRRRSRCRCTLPARRTRRSPSASGVAQIFLPNQPGPGQVRLHLPGDKSSKTWKSRQEGLYLLAQGAFAGIRNVAAHTVGERSEQVALEHLAVLSVVARWADETQVVTGRRG